MNISIKSVDDNKTTLIISGKQVNYSTVNTIRRILLTEIPTYALAKKNIHISKNTTIYDNDYMSLRLGNITVPNLNNDAIMIDDYKDDKIDMYLNSKNNTNNVSNITTDELVFFKDGVEMKNPFDVPNLIIKLRPNEEFNFHGKLTIGKAYVNEIWAAVSPCFYEIINENKYKFTFETLEQLTYKQILNKCFKIIVKKLENIELVVGNAHKKINSNKITIVLDNESHTMGNLIITKLQDDVDVLYAGYKKDHVLVNNITMKIETKTINPLKNLFKTIDELKKIYKIKI